MTHLRHRKDRRMVRTAGWITRVGMVVAWAVFIAMFAWLGMAQAEVEGEAIVTALEPGEVVSFTFTGSDFYIPRPAEASDQVGVERLIGTYDLVANGYGDLIGLTCVVSGLSANGESVHINNYGLLVSNGDDVVITGTEDEANGVRLSSKTIVLGPTVNLYNIMIPDEDGIVATSVDYEVTVTCTGTEVTTTTAPTTTTTSEPFTTTSSLPSTTVTSEPTTTTTLQDSSTTSSSTTVPPITTTTIPTTTTSFGETTSTTTPESTSSTDTTVPPVTESTLPFTGPPVDAVGIAMAGMALLMLGGGLVVAAREGR